MKLSHLYRHSLLQAKELGVPDSAVRLLLAETLKLGNAELDTLPDKEIGADQQELWLQRLHRLLKGEPAQYIAQQAWFWGFALKIQPGVLIPRPETEGLVELMLPRLQPGIKVLDCCTGSGAIAIALSQLKPDIKVFATDISAPAINLAIHNASLHSAAIRFYQCDLFPAIQHSFDIIVSNPPYISEAEYRNLDGVVKDYEPSEALLSGEDGLHHITRILQEAPLHLKDGGLLYLEHGATQREAILKLADAAHWKLDYAGDDLAGYARYLVFSHHK
ncbi:MAG: peptide chain release factor N(5)-glutamine methyltransferase [Candidatus Cloacimonetes bacterium]|nr:peptide chain release factor N(5)-glutamine methyltransferase [Candidatus Cloacimonadota bacterium]